MAAVSVCVQVACHGLLNKKQVSEGQGRKSSDRSWRTFYTVLVGTHMVFYKERREADAVSVTNSNSLSLFLSCTYTYMYSEGVFVYTQYTVFNKNPPAPKFQ